MNSWQNWNQLAADGCWISMEGDKTISPTIIPCGYLAWYFDFLKTCFSYLLFHILEVTSRMWDHVVWWSARLKLSPAKFRSFKVAHLWPGCLWYLLDFMIFYPYLGVYAVAKNTTRMTFSTFMSSRWSVKACLLGGKLPSFPFIPRRSYWWCTILIIL